MTGNKPFRLIPFDERPEFSCNECNSALVENFSHDFSTGYRYFDCPNCNLVLIPEYHARRKTEFTALGSISKRRKSETKFVAVSPNRRTITQGPRSNPDLPKSRVFNRNQPDESLGLRPEDIPLLAGKEDKELLELLNHGVMTSLVTSEGEGE